MLFCFMFILTFLPWFNLKRVSSSKFKKSLNIIRLGTSGSLNKDILVDSIIVSSYAIGFDALAHFYKIK